MMKAFIPSSIRHCTRRRRAGHVRATSLPRGGNVPVPCRELPSFVCSDATARGLRVLRSCPVRICAFRAWILDPRFTQVSPVPCVCRTGHEKDPLGTLVCMTISQQPSSHRDDQVAINFDRWVDDDRSP